MSFSDITEELLQTKLRLVHSPQQEILHWTCILTTVNTLEFTWDMTQQARSMASCTLYTFLWKNLLALNVSIHFEKNEWIMPRAGGEHLVWSSSDKVSQVLALFWYQDGSHRVCNCRELLDSFWAYHFRAGTPERLLGLNRLRVLTVDS